MTETAAVNRLDRRKVRTRAALVAAARELLASRDPAAVSIQEITDTADVGFGSFYNHFESKVELFDAAIEEVFEEQGALFDALTAEMEDPAEVFASSVRMTVRMTKTHPQVTKIFQRTGLRYLDASMAWPRVPCAICAGARKAAGSTLTIRWLRWPALAVPWLACWPSPPPIPIRTRSTPPPMSLRSTCSRCLACRATRPARSPVGRCPRRSDSTRRSSRRDADGERFRPGHVASCDVTALAGPSDELS